METLRVATLNLWNRSGDWEARRSVIHRELDILAPDLLGLQEVIRLETEEGADDQANEVVRDRGYHTAYGTGHVLGSDDRIRLLFGNALASRYPIVKSETIELPGADVSDQRRSVLYCVVEAPFGPIPVFVMHLNWKLHESHIRIGQVRFLASLVKDREPIDPARYPPVVMGDFNAEPDSDEIRFLTGLATIDGESVYFADAWRYGGEGAGHTFDPSNPHAAPLHEPPRRIDYVFVRGPDEGTRAKPTATRLAFHTPFEGVHASDHFGVVTDLTIGR
jgi:endonuclease/exonuclease/phosphatase family metal-dependent hydrolase